MFNQRSEMKSIISVLMVVLFTVAITGCASIVSGRHQVVSIKSQPDEANVKVYNIKGEVVSDSKTPFSVAIAISFFTL